MKVLFATGNASKAKRFSKGLEANEIEVISLNDINTSIEVDENGKDAIENALIKARAYSNLGYPVFAMDDNLYLDGVPEDMQPGMFVRRVNGKRLNDEEMLTHYIDLVKRFGRDGKLTCRWVYGMALINNGREYTYTWSKEDFYMVDTPSDKVNKDYPLNSISVNKKLNKYFTDMTEEDRMLVQEDESHVVDFITNSIKDSMGIEKIR